MSLIEIEESSITLCDGCERPGQKLLYIHKQATEIILNFDRNGVDVGVNVFVELNRGVYVYKFDEAWRAGLDVTVKADSASGRAFLSHPLCCNSGVVVELSKGTAPEEFTTILNDMEDEESFYQPKSVCFHYNGEAETLADKYGVITIE